MRSGTVAGCMCMPDFGQSLICRHWWWICEIAVGRRPASNFVFWLITKSQRFCSVLIDDDCDRVCPLLLHTIYLNTGMSFEYLIILPGSSCNGEKAPARLTPPSELSFFFFLSFFLSLLVWDRGEKGKILLRTKSRRLPASETRGAITPVPWLSE